MSSSESIFSESIEWLNLGRPLIRGDKIEDQNGRIFELRKPIGAGFLSLVYKVKEILKNGETKTYALKIPANGDDSVESMDFEGNVLDFLCDRCPGIEDRNLSYYIETIEINDHPCVLMEYLGPSVFNILDKNGYVGLQMRTVQDAMRCVFETLKDIASINVMHMDIKPENILQTREDKHCFKLVDFHLAGIMGRDNSSYVQSRFFRAPEVLLHIDYGTKIDVWSLAVTAFEMFVGMPLFPGDTEVQMFYLINEMLGPFPEHLIKNSPRKNTFFLNNGLMKPAKRLAEENMEDVSTWRIWFRYNSITENIMTHQCTPTDLSEKESRCRMLFADLLEKCLKLDPEERISAEEALKHPFFAIDLK